MNITSTAQKPMKKSLVKLEVDADALTTGVFDVTDKVIAGAKRSGEGLFVGAICTIPGLGISFSRHLYSEAKKGKFEMNKASGLALAGNATLQMAGFATAALAVGSSLTGFGNPDVLWTISGGCFVAGGVSSFASVVLAPEDKPTP